MEVHHEIGVSFNQGGEIDDHDAVDHGHKRNNTGKVKVIFSSKKSCRPEHHKKESEDAKPFLSSLGRQERLRCSWHLSQSAKICPIIVILKSCNLKIILIINHPEWGFLRILSSTPPMKPSGSDQNCCGLTVDRLITNGPATRISAMRWWGTGRDQVLSIGMILLQSLLLRILVRTNDNGFLWRWKCPNWSWCFYRGKFLILILSFKC